MKNLLKKYGISEAVWQATLKSFEKNIKKIEDVNVMFAVCDLLNNGDIKAEVTPDAEGN